MTYSLPVFVNTVNSATPDYRVSYSQTLTGGTITALRILNETVPDGITYYVK